MIILSSDLINNLRFEVEFYVYQKRCGESLYINLLTPFIKWILFVSDLVEYTLYIEGYFDSFEREVQEFWNQNFFAFNNGCIIATSCFLKSISVKKVKLEKYYHNTF